MSGTQSPIRSAVAEDLGRIAEIEIFNYRLFFYPVFRNDCYYFSHLQVESRAAEYAAQLHRLWVYDDGVVKGFCMVQDGELRRLFVEPVLQGRGIGAALLQHAVQLGAERLWALQQNCRAIAFYQRHGFMLTDELRPEEGTDAYLVCMRYTAAGTKV